MASRRDGLLLGQIVRFAISTVFSASLSLGLPILLAEEFGLEQRLAVAIGFATAYVGNLLLIRNFVFRSESDWRSDAKRYVFTNGAFRIAEYGGFLMLFSWFEIDYRLAVLLVLAVSSTVKFFVYRWIFAPAPA